MISIKHKQIKLQLRKSLIFNFFFLSVRRDFIKKKNANPNIHDIYKSYKRVLKL